MKFLLSLFMLAIATPSFAAFPDVPSSHPHAEAITYLETNNIVAGNPDGTFAPDKTISRAAFTKIVVETYFGASFADSCAVSSISFSDVPANAWFSSYICVAAQEGLIKGYPDGTFRPGDNINVAEAAKIISAYRKGTQTGEPWYRPYIEDLATEGALPEEVDAVEQLVDRGIMAEIIYRLKAKKKNKPARNKDFFFKADVSATISTDLMVKIPTGKFELEADLSPVEGYKATGTAKARYNNGKYELVAEFSNLISPGNNYFYEGWIVRKGLITSVISTGKAEWKDGRFVNIYISDKDLTDHTEYVLTIEPDDGDPAPADHVVEGSFESPLHEESENEGTNPLYQSYSKSRFDELVATNQDFILNFGASWCPNCRALDAKLNADLNLLPAGAVVLEVDYDSATDLRKKYKVTRQTTGVYFRNGVYTETKSGLSFEAIASFFE